MRPSPNIISPSSDRAVARAQRIFEGGGRIPSMTARPDLQYRDNVAGFGGDSEDSADSQDSQDDEVDIEPIALVAPIHSLPSERPGKRAKKSPLPRAVVDELHIVELVKSYRKEFAIFCKGKKQAPKQMVPGKVWEKVYSHYRILFPSSAFEEDTLKKHLREQLAELGTGIADDGERPVLQDEDVGNEVRATDRAATRNMLRLRQGFLSGVANRASAPVPTTTSTPPVLSSAPTTPTPAAQGTGPEITTPQPSRDRLFQGLQQCEAVEWYQVLVVIVVG